VTKAIEELKRDHALIKRTLAVIDGMLGDGQRPDRLQPEALRQAIDFVRGFAERCHQAKEERALFPLLAAKNETIARGPVHMLEAEHEAGHVLISELEAALPGLEAGETRAQKQATRALLLFSRMLRRHIAKEDDILFPLAAALISEAEAAHLAREIEAVQEEVGPDAYATFAALVESLERSAGLTVSSGRA